MHTSLAKEVFSSGELGNADGARMLRSGDGSLWSLFLTFHSQMKKNYPDASKVLLIWPLLWAMTLARFIYNNKHIRKVSTKDVLKEARSRGKSTEGIKLFVR